MNVVHSLELSEISTGSKLWTTFLNIAKETKKHGEITTKFQFTGTGVQPHRNRKFIQFDYVQYCNHASMFACTVTDRR